MIGLQVWPYDHFVAGFAKRGFPRTSIIIADQIYDQEEKSTAHVTKNHGPRVMARAANNTDLPTPPPTTLQKHRYVDLFAPQGTYR